MNCVNDRKVAELRQAEADRIRQLEPKALRAELATTTWTESNPGVPTMIVFAGLCTFLAIYFVLAGPRTSQGSVAFLVLVPTSVALWWLSLTRLAGFRATVRLDEAGIKYRRSPLARSRFHTWAECDTFVVTREVVGDNSSSWTVSYAESAIDRSPRKSTILQLPERFGTADAMAVILNAYRTTYGRLSTE